MIKVPPTIIINGPKLLKVEPILVKTSCIFSVVSFVVSVSCFIASADFSSGVISTCEASAISADAALIASLYDTPIAFAYWAPAIGPICFNFSPNSLSPAPIFSGSIFPEIASVIEIPKAAYAGILASIWVGSVKSSNNFVDVCAETPTFSKAETVLARDILYLWTSTGAVFPNALSIPLHSVVVFIMALTPFFVNPFAWATFIKSAYIAVVVSADTCPHFWSSTVFCATSSWLILNALASP